VFVKIRFQLKCLFAAVSDSCAACSVEVRPETSWLTFPTQGKTPAQFIFLFMGAGCEHHVKSETRMSNTANAEVILNRLSSGTFYNCCLIYIYETINWVSDSDGSEKNVCCLLECNIVWFCKYVPMFLEKSPAFILSLKKFLDSTAWLKYSSP
jgi:hypothetical protein